MSQDAVRSWEDTVSIPTYVFDRLDDHPDLFLQLRRWNVVYPYPRQDDLTTVREARQYRALHVENRWLHLIVCPDLGGHLYSLLDKRSGQEVFYLNDVVRPVPLGLRGAWIPVGIEWNFPVAHSPTTLSPVSTTIVPHDDGSVGVLVGEVERLRRMEWSVEMRLHPDRAYLESRVTLYNRTDYPQSYYWWANAAISVDQGTHYIFPTRHVRGHGFKDAGQPWPMNGTVDCSWHSNLQGTFGIFATNCREDFFGAYNVERDAGVAHVADYRTVPGKKLFDWGVREAGQKWAHQLTENAGAYAEIQAGLFENQSDYELFPPHSVRRFVEYWLPVHGLGGFVRVNRDAAVNLQRSDGSTGRWRLAVNVTREIPGACLRLTIGDRTVWTETTDLSPQTPLSREIDLQSQDVQPELVVTDAAGREVLRHRPEGPHPAQRQAGWLDEQDDTPSQKGPGLNPERLTSRGLNMEKSGYPRLASAAYHQALKIDPDFSQAHVRLGIIAARGGDWVKAREHLTHALRRNHNQPEVHHYLGTVWLGTGDLDRAQDQFWVAMRMDDHPGRNAVQMGRIAMLHHRYDEATPWFERAMVTTDSPARVGAWLSAALRQTGRIDEARKTLESARKENRLSFALAAEKWFLTGTDADRVELLTLLDRQIHYFLELACDYINVGLVPEATKVLELGIDRTTEGKWSSPLLHYLLGWCLDARGDRQAAGREFAAARRCSRRMVFPLGPEMERALRKGLEYDTTDDAARVLLGHLLYGSVRDHEALEMWQEAAKRVHDDPVLWWCLATGSWEAGKLKKGVAYLKRAIRCAPTRKRYRHQLDQMQEAAGMDEARLRSLSHEFRRDPGDDIVRVRLAALNIDRGNHQQALDLLSNHVFTSQHGIWTLTRLHQHANIGLGEEMMRRKDPAKALEYFDRSMKPPVELGEDWSRFRGQAKSLYCMGLALEALDRKTEARKCFRQASDSELGYTSDLSLYRAMALTRLGKKAQADQTVKKVEERLHDAQKRQTLDEGYCNYIRSLIAQYHHRPTLARKLWKKAVTGGWRPSEALQVKWRMGVS